MNTEVNKRTQCGWNNWRKMSGILRDKRIPPHVKGHIHNMIVQPAILHGMETVPVTRSNGVARIFVWGGGTRFIFRHLSGSRPHSVGGG